MALTLATKGDFPGRLFLKLELRTMEREIEYRDIILFLILIPFINALNYYLTYNNINFNGHTLMTFSIDTCEGYAAWWGIRLVVKYLDKRMPYASNPE